jgi:energy-coupling factor transporter ATP-binding protein EcfA2
MKISHVTIQNYRSIENLDVDFDDYASFVGANGSGKSSVLYAVNWLINGGNLDPADVHSCPADADDAAKAVSVTATFTDLNARDRERLEKYGRGETVTIRRSWSVGDAKPKVVGSAMQGPNFINVRSAGSVGDARSAYEALRVIHTGLEEPGRLPSKADLDALLNNWEDDPAHKTELVAIDDDDATNFFGFDGQNRLKQCIRLVLVPAASDIASEVAGTKRGSAINELIGVLMTNAGSTAREQWILDHATEIQELTDSMKLGVETATGLQATRINERLETLITGAAVSFVTDVPSWVPSPTPTVTTDVVLDGIVNDVSKQGHGIQRAVMIAMFQSLTPDEGSAEQAHEIEDGETEAQAAERLRQTKEDLPALIICIEEPEIYQHPIRARSFARVLVDLSTKDKVQVLLATHSPYFVRPADFESLRRFTLRNGESSVNQTTIDAIAGAIGGPSKRSQVEKTVSQQLPTSFAEGFFADAVVLVEGDTDKAVLEELAQKMGRPFDTAGISILNMGGKGSLRIPAIMLQKLGIPTYIVADGDSLGAARKHPADAVAAATVHGSHKGDTDSLMVWLPVSTTATHGTLPYAFEDGSVVTENYAVWEDDIENELANWPSFVAAQSANSHQVRQKDMLAYRVDVVDSDVADVPASLLALVDAIHLFKNAI